MLSIIHISYPLLNYRPLNDRRLYYRTSFLAWDLGYKTSKAEHVGVFVIETSSPARPFSLFRSRFYIQALIDICKCLFILIGDFQVYSNPGIDIVLNNRDRRRGCESTWGCMLLGFLLWIWRRHASLNTPEITRGLAPT